MSPIVFLVVGLIMVWAVFTGRAGYIWKAIIGTPGTSTTTNTPPVTGA
jgi:hypothetical protein